MNAVGVHGHLDHPDHEWVHPGLPPAPEPRRELSDAGAVLLAGGVALGSWWAHPLPRSVGLAVLLVAVVRRSPPTLVVGAFLLAAAFGHRAEAGLAPPEPGPYRGVVTLVSDPRDTPWGVRVDVRLGSKRYELEADGGAAGTVGLALAGERLQVDGRIRPPPRHAPWLVPRHVVGRLSVETVDVHDAGAAPWRAANRFRRLLQRGAEVMDEPARSLYGGFVLGDDRGQSPEIVDDFRASGLTHLLVVSGSNVAYLLVMASPITNRLNMWPRWGATLVVVAGFALLTRFEPSILRASAMAAVAVTAALAGRPSGAIRTLALAVAGLLLLDPLLVHSVGFQLSVAASLGIVILSRSIAGVLRGPDWLRDALGVTLAAQLAVAPVLVPRFGGMPVVAIVANLVAVPAAGIVTTWGLPAGVVAGVFGPSVGRWVHLPTSVSIEWVAVTARTAARIPLGELRTPHLAVLTVATAAAVVAHARKATWLGRCAAACALCALMAPALALRSAPFEVEPVPGARIYRAGGATVLVVERSPSPATALESFRRVGLRRVDLLVNTDPSEPLVRTLRHRWSVGRVVDLSSSGNDSNPRLDLRIGGLRVRTVRRGSTHQTSQAGPGPSGDDTDPTVEVEVTRYPP